MLESAIHSEQRMGQDANKYPLPEIKNQNGVSHMSKYGM
jgi:hypothetical protein